jgi:hypothetical protein
MQMQLVGQTAHLQLDHIGQGGQLGQMVGPHLSHVAGHVGRVVGQMGGPHLDHGPLHYPAHRSAPAAAALAAVAVVGALWSPGALVL